MGIAEIFFQDNWVTGILILIGIAINTWIGAVMACMGLLRHRAAQKR